MLKIATWNVNSIAKRLERVLAFLEREQPDVLCLQELKCIDEKFPQDSIVAAGYNAAVYGQKAYNGVALLTKTKATEVFRGFNDKVDDPMARLVGGRIGEITVMSAYCPNGQAVGTSAYEYKLEWYRRLGRFLSAHFKPTDPVLLMGDFNVAPEDRDVYDPVGWRGQVLCSARERDALQEVVQFGFYDTFRLHHQEAGLYSWWDYRQMAFIHNRGLRIDMIYATRPLAERCGRSRIDRQERKGESPSDHAPVISEFEV